MSSHLSAVQVYDLSYVHKFVLLNSVRMGLQRETFIQHNFIAKCGKTVQHLMHNVAMYNVQCTCTTVHCMLGVRWLNKVFACTFADAIQCAHKDCKNKHAINRAISLFTQHPHYLCYFSLLLNAVYWWL